MLKTPSLFALDVESSSDISFTLITVFIRPHLMDLWWLNCQFFLKTHHTFLVGAWIGQNSFYNRPFQYCIVIGFVPYFSNILRKCGVNFFALFLTTSYGNNAIFWNLRMLSSILFDLLLNDTTHLQMIMFLWQIAWKLHVFRVLIIDFCVMWMNDPFHIFGVGISYLHGISIKGFMQID